MKEIIAYEMVYNNEPGIKDRFLALFFCPEM